MTPHCFESRAVRPCGWCAARSATVFIGGWIFQLIGHGIERRRPVLVDNLWQIFIAPLFPMAEAFFAMGYKQDLKRKVEALREQP